MTPEQHILAGIAALAVTAYGLKAGGYLLARWIRPESFGGRVLQRAPGNLFVAFIAVGVATGGKATLVGVIAALLAAFVIRHELAVLLAGAAGVIITNWLG